MAFVFLYAPASLILRLNRLEFAVNDLLHVRQTDFITGYWELFLPGIPLGLCILVLLRLFSRAPFELAILRAPAGVAAVAGPPLWWLCATYLREHRSGWSPLRSIQTYELVGAFCCVLFYLYARQAIPVWVILSILIVHYAFWLWQFWPLFVTFFRGWGGASAVTLVVALCSCLAWLFYEARLEATDS
jgi:hypothetical protein